MLHFLNTIVLKGAPTCVIFLTIVILVYGILFWFCSDNEEFSVMAVAIMFISIALFIGCIIIEHNQPNGKVRYEVVVDDSVSFTEFNEKYIIIDKQGDIYTIEERD